VTSEQFVALIAALVAVAAGTACVLLVWRGPFWRRCLWCFGVAAAIGWVGGMIAGEAL